MHKEAIAETMSDATYCRELKHGEAGPNRGGSREPQPALLQRSDPLWISPHGPSYSARNLSRLMVLEG